MKNSVHLLFIDRTLLTQLHRSGLCMIPSADILPMYILSFQNIEIIVKKYFEALTITSKS